MKRFAFILSLFLILILSGPEFAQNDLAKGISPERNQAFELFQKGQYLQAIPILTRQTKLNSKDAEAWNVLGLAYLQNRKVQGRAKSIRESG